MKRSRLLVAALPLLAALGCSPSSTPLLLVDKPDGAAPAALEVRVYDKFGQLANRRIARPELPGAIPLANLPAPPDGLRVVLVGLDGDNAVQTLAGQALPVPLTSGAEVHLALSTSFSDGDHDGVPDALDDCPLVPDPEQKSAAGFPGVGDACIMPPCPDGAFCDSFDAATLDSRWEVETPAGKVPGISIDNHRFFRGGGSLHAHLDALTAGKFAAAVIKEKDTFPATTLFARAFVFMPREFTSDAAAIMLVEQSESPFANLSLQLEQGGFSMFNSLRANAPSANAAGSMARDTWVCLEWAVKIDQHGSAALSVNDARLPAPAISDDTTTSPALGELAIGLLTSASGNVPARDVWIDELVVSSSPIGCK